MARFQRCLVCLSFWLLISACSFSTATPTPTEPLPTVPPPTPTPLPTTTPEPQDSGWRALSPGIEWRRLWAETGVGRERLTLVRLDPDQVRLRVIYQPAHPRRVSEWVQALPAALLVVNAGYFTPELQAAGLLISDGIPSGRSYGDFAGMLAVSADGRVSLRWLRTRPFDPDEGLVQAVQSFPVLVKPGRLMGFPPDADEGQRSRRTVVAQDGAGRIILLASPLPRFSLHELAVWLTESDLELEIAMNLDGGTSTGLWIKGQDDPIDSLVPIPAVIAVEPVGK
jgi:uncharacterized protein YigE (DUF2233 family)